MALPDDYKNMTLEELENYIEGFLSAKYGEEVRDNFARIAYLLGQHVEDTGTDASNAESAKETAVDKAQEAAESAQQAQDIANQVEAYAKKIFEVDVRAEVISQKDYDALDTPRPKTIYIVITDGPEAYLKAYYPLHKDVTDMLSGRTGSIVGNGSFTGSALRTASSGTVSQHQNYIQLPENLFEGLDIKNSNGMTIALDVMPDTACTAGNGDWTRLLQFYKQNNLPTETGEGDLYLTQGCIANAYYNDTQVQALNASVANAITAGKWHTVVLVVNGYRSGVSVYVDGVNKASNSGSQSDMLEHMAEFTQNYIGNSRFADNDFVGLVRNLRVYNKALTSDEIDKIGTAPKWSLHYNSEALDCLPATGGKMSGAIDMDGNNINNVQVIQGKYGQAMSIGPFSVGEIAIGSTAGVSPVIIRGNEVRLQGLIRGPEMYDKVKITGVADPSEGTDAASKSYVDAAVSALEARIAALESKSEQ